MQRLLAHRNRLRLSEHCRSSAKDAQHKTISRTDKHTYFNSTNTLFIQHRHRATDYLLLARKLCPLRQLQQTIPQGSFWSLLGQRIWSEFYDRPSRMNTGSTPWFLMSTDVIILNSPSWKVSTHPPPQHPALSSPHPEHSFIQTKTTL